jgi:hypothetical protein
LLRHPAAGLNQRADTETPVNIGAPPAHCRFEYSNPLCKKA